MLPRLLGKAAYSLYEFTQFLCKHPQSLNKLVQSLNKLFQSFNKLAQSFNKLAQSLNKLVQSLNKLAQSLNKLAQSFNKLSQPLNKLFYQLNFRRGKGKNFWMFIIQAHGSDGGLLFARPKSNQKGSGTYGFRTSLHASGNRLRHPWPSVWLLGHGFRCPLR